MPGWRVKFKPEAENDLEKVAPDIARRVIEKLEWLESNFDFITPAPLAGDWKRRFKLRVGDWRVIYAVDWDKRIIIVEVIDKRDKIYKRR